MSESTFHPIVADHRNKEVRTVETVEELDEVLDRWDALARHDEPALVFLDVGDTNNHYYIGLGQDEVPVACGYRHAVGKRPNSDECEEWAFANTWQEVGPDELVPAADAREATRRWARTGERPDNLRWIQDR